MLRKERFLRKNNRVEKILFSKGLKFRESGFFLLHRRFAESEKETWSV